MKKELKAPLKPTKEEAAKLKQYIWMADWHFEETIKKKCTEIESHCIHWTGEDWKRAVVYGLKAIKSTTQESCIANLFIRYHVRVYQTNMLASVTEIINLLKKEEKYDEYEKKVWDRKYKERQKLFAEKQKERGKLRKLKIVKKKAA